MTIAILTGGTSSEREVALQSAASVKQAISDRAEVTTLDIPKDLNMFLAERGKFDCVIPVFHGRGGEDGTIQGFLETLGMPYIFSRVGGHALAIDKPRVNLVIGAAGIAVPHGELVQEGTKLKFTKPVVIKPVDGGSSIGITIAHNQAELETGVMAARKQSSAVMVEEYIEGQEFSVAVIDLEGKSIALPVISIKPKHEFFDYQSKYETGLAEETCPADIPPDLASRLQSAALTVHKTIGARHVTRTDFIVDQQEKIWFLDVNTIPGMVVLLPMPIRASGRDFGDVLMSWVMSVIST
ncbi:MAG: D-alanine--D-alanine ligase [Candidatus Kerfeldbacteria bacterium]|nr:D-alanine--D-alanine ligase [Candidatus Kerfeldbacteria bacterium]